MKKTTEKLNWPFSSVLSMNLEYISFFAFEQVETMDEEKIRKKNCNSISQFLKAISRFTNDNQTYLQLSKLI